jgi:hypothetical protein
MDDELHYLSLIFFNVDENAFACEWNYHVLFTRTAIPSKNKIQRKSTQFKRYLYLLIYESIDAHLLKLITWSLSHGIWILFNSSS